VSPYRATTFAFPFRRASMVSHLTSVGLRSRLILRGAPTAVDLRWGRIPGALKDLLAAGLVRAEGPAPRTWSRPKFWLITTFAWRRGIQWAGAVVPVAAVTIVISLGVLPSPGGRPTHPSTPCTIHLRSHHTAHGTHAVVPLSRLPAT